jgi:hypothetical protein
MYFNKITSIRSLEHQSHQSGPGATFVTLLVYFCACFTEKEIEAQKVKWLTPGHAAGE